MRRIAVLCHGGDDCPGEAFVRLTDHGRCELALGEHDDLRCFQCSLSALINVGLGAKTHLASDYGSCTLSRQPGGVKITVSEWGGIPFQYLVPLDDYADGLARLSEAQALKSKVSLR
jgi:hypothetical protein